MRSPRLWGCALVLGLSCATLPVAAETIRVGGVERSFLADLAGPGVAPVLIVLHGGEGNARRMQRYAGLDAAAAGVHVIYPEAVDRWGDGRVLADGSLLAATDDVAFLDALIDALAQQGLADPDRIAIAGISNGGMMAIRMACDSRHDLAGLAVVAANWPEGFVCARLRAVSFLHFTGTEDPLLPFHGGAVQGRDDLGRVLSSDETMRRFLTASGCNGEKDTPLPDVAPADGTRVTLRTGIVCSGPAPRQYIIMGGGHTWPGARATLQRLLGPTSADISASSIMLEEFFGR